MYIAFWQQHAVIRWSRVLVDDVITASSCLKAWPSRCIYRCRSHTALPARHRHRAFVPEVVGHRKWRHWRRKNRTAASTTKTGRRSTISRRRRFSCSERLLGLEIGALRPWCGHILCALFSVADSNIAIHTCTHSNNMWGQAVSIILVIVSTGWPKNATVCVERLNFVKY